MSLNTIPELIEAIRQGQIVILMDDENRENEGDFVMAAEHVTPEHINFMTRYGRGLVCLPMSKAHCVQLGLPLMVPDANQSRFGTNFTLSIEAAEGVTTGISAADRARTIQAAVQANATPDNIVQPGHIFPIMAQPGGVLSRAGHTEAACDLARLAGLSSAGVLIEILNEDGSMARRPQLEVIAAEHQLKIGTIADLIHYRVTHEKTVECISQQELVTAFGVFQLSCYLDNLNEQLHFVLSMGDCDGETSCPVRVHYQDTLTDLFAVKGWEKSCTLHQAMQYVAERQLGVIVVLGHSETQAQVLQRIQQIATHHQAVDHSFDESLRMIGAGARILRDMGVHKMQVMGAPKKMHALSGFGLEVVDYITEFSHETD